MTKSKGEKEVPNVIQMGMKSEAWWEETVKLSRELGIPPTQPIKEVLRKIMPEWNKILKIEVEKKEEVEKMKDKILGDVKKGGATKNPKKS